MNCIRSDPNPGYFSRFKSGLSCRTDCEGRTQIQVIVNCLNWFIYMYDIVGAGEIPVVLDTLKQHYFIDRSFFNYSGDNRRCDTPLTLVLMGGGVIPSSFLKDYFQSQH